LPNSKNSKESSLPEQQPVAEVKEEIKAPEATAVGDEKVSILNHKLCMKYGEHGELEKAGVELGINNISDTAIGTIVFEAEFYDRDGNIVDTAECSEFELLPHTKGRTVYITSSSPERDKIESYNVRLVKTTTPPTPKATGNEKITILKHELSVEQVYADLYRVSADLAIKNISDSTIATVVFGAEFYDKDGNVVEEVKHWEIDFQPNQSRGVRIFSSSFKDIKEIWSYSVKIVRMTTTDIEKVQLCRKEMRTTENGEIDVKGSVKNISKFKTDAALVADFYNFKNENIGTKVIILRDIEPRIIKQFNFVFKPIEGDKVGDYTLEIVCDIEGK